MEEYRDYKGAQGQFEAESFVVWNGDGFMSLHIYISKFNKFYTLLHRGYFQPLLTAK